MRLPDVKMLLRWPSRMHIYDFVESHTFLEQFVSIFYGNVGPPECIFIAPLTPN